MGVISATFKILEQDEDRFYDCSIFLDNYYGITEGECWYHHGAEEKKIPCPSCKDFYCQHMAAAYLRAIPSDETAKKYEKLDNNQECGLKIVGTYTTPLCLF